MATKTISIDLEAYEALRRARLFPDESFSKVIKRTLHQGPVRTAGAYLAAVKGLPVATEDELRVLDQGQELDSPAEDKWREG